jgi:probable HAF family extracellular repeat protein
MFARLMTATTVATAVLCAVAGPASAQTVHLYRVEDLGSFGGDVYAQAINSQGEAAGSASMPDGTLHVVRWTAAGGLEDLGMNGGVQAQGAGINDSGEIVGTYFDAGYTAHNFVVPRGGPFRDLSPDIFQVSSIANAGWITGYTWNAHAFTSLVDGPPQEFANYVSFGTHVNEAGHATGWGWPTDLSLPSIAFRYTPAAGSVILGTLGGASGGTSINNSDVVVGWSEGTSGRGYRAFRARPGLAIEDLGSLPGGFAGGVARADGINDAGDIVGQSDSPSGWTAFLHTDADGLVDLNTRIPVADRSTHLQAGLAINNAGQILVGYDGATGYRAVRLTPIQSVPTPVISAVAADPPILSPAHAQMVAVSILPSVTDTYDPAPACRITAVINTDHLADGIDRDVMITGPLSVNLRAQGAGRLYFAVISCANAFGRSTSAVATVAVRRDR